MGVDDTPAARRARLAELVERARGCVRCPQLVASRATVVAGSGSEEAEVVLVALAPDANEDRQGLALVGAPGRLLGRLLAEAGLDRERVFVTSAVRCRPPDGRDPDARELAACRAYLDEQLEILRPRVVCPLGNAATKLLRGDPAPIRSVRGRDEVRVLAGRAVRVLPLFHPASALYREEHVDALRADLGRIPGLLALPAPEAPAPEPAPVVAGRPGGAPADGDAPGDGASAPDAAPDDDRAGPATPGPPADPAQLELF